MSGFHKDWLALREPADMEARSQKLVGHLAASLTSSPSAPMVLDIGCGTGSTFRALSPALPAEANWTMVDYDPALLEEARRKISRQDVVFRCEDLDGLDEGLLETVDIVTASALFDLCSAAFCERFAARLSKRKTGLYAALNYDGVISWSMPHPLDKVVVEDFNRHQQSDKGFGPALGPFASEQMKRIFEGLDYRCITAPSPWRLSERHGTLHAEFLRGFEAPLLEIGRLSKRDIKSWLDFRLSNVSESGSLCTVGHIDILALAA